MKRHQAWGIIDSTDDRLWADVYGQVEAYQSRTEALAACRIYRAMGDSGAHDRVIKVEISEPRKKRKGAT